MLNKSEGRVAFFNADKGYGFIIPDAGGPDVFVHVSNIPDHLEDLQQGQGVRYDVRESSRVHWSSRLGSLPSCSSS